MRKLINLIALLIMASSVTWAQDKKSFTLEDLMPGGNNYYNLLPQNLYEQIFDNIDMINSAFRNNLYQIKQKRGEYICKMIMCMSI